MMKKLLFILVTVFLSATYTHAQDLTLSWKWQSLGDTIIAYGDANADEIVCHAVVTNNSSEAMNIKVSRERLSLQDGTNSFFQWVKPYPPTTTVSLQYKLIKSGEKSAPDDFSGHYLPNNVLGNSYIKYTFFNMDNESQSVSVIVKFMATPTGIAEEAMANGTVSEIYPNPASSFITLDYQLTNKVNTSEVKIFNLMGSEVKSASLENNGSKLRLDISELKSGIYFYSILINNDVYQTKKLVVQR